jgi:hypothetical protein
MRRQAECVVCIVTRELWLCVFVRARVCVCVCVCLESLHPSHALRR